MKTYDCKELFNPNACTLCLYFSSRLGCTQDVCCCDEPQHPVLRHGKAVNYPEPLLLKLAALRSLTETKAKAKTEEELSYPEPLLRMFEALRSSAETGAK